MLKSDEIIWNLSETITIESQSTQKRIHCITNYVTANQVANILLASNASPIMADSEVEVEEVISKSVALALNIGTINPNRAKAMHLAYQKALDLKKPIVLDPVGCAATDYRLRQVQSLLALGPPSILKGNASEIKALSISQTLFTGIDADKNDPSPISHGRLLAKDLNTIIIMTGIEDYVFYGSETYVVKNGHDNMSKFTGAGCMLTGILAHFQAICPEAPLESALIALAHFGVCGERAAQNQEVHSTSPKGLATFYQNFWDAYSLLTPMDTRGEFNIERIS